MVRDLKRGRRVKPSLGGDISAGIRPQSGLDEQDHWGRALV